MDDVPIFLRVLPFVLLAAGFLTLAVAIVFDDRCGVRQPYLPQIPQRHEP